MVLFLPKDFFAKQMLASSKLFCNNICVYLPTKFQVSSIILTSFRQGVLCTPLPPTANKSRKSQPRVGLKSSRTYLYRFGKNLKLFRISCHQHNFLYVLSNIVFYMKGLAAHAEYEGMTKVQYLILSMIFLKN